MGHLDAVIGMFNPSFDLASIRSKRPRAPDATKPGEMSRFVLEALRDAKEPTTAPAIAAQLMAERGMDGHDRKLVQVVVKRVGMMLRHQERQGTVRSHAGPGRVAMWMIAV